MIRPQRPYTPADRRCPHCGTVLRPADELPDSTEWSCLYCEAHRWAGPHGWLAPTLDVRGTEPTHKPRLGHGLVR